MFELLNKPVIAPEAVLVMVKLLVPKVRFPLNKFKTDATVVALFKVNPDALFKVAVCAGTNSNTVSYLTQAAVGSNVKLANGANNVGSTSNGNSKVGVDSTEGTTSTWPIRVVDVVPETALAGSPGSYTEVIVKWNQGMHQYLNPTGV